jgi:hypothetical protein
MRIPVKSFRLMESGASFHTMAQADETRHGVCEILVRHQLLVLNRGRKRVPNPVRGGSYHRRPVTHFVRPNATRGRPG